MLDIFTWTAFSWIRNGGFWGISFGDLLGLREQLWTWTLLKLKYLQNIIIRFFWFSIWKYKHCFICLLHSFLFFIVMIGADLGPVHHMSVNVSAGWNCKWFGLRPHFSPSWIICHSSILRPHLLLLLYCKLPSIDYAYTIFRVAAGYASCLRWEAEYMLDRRPVYHRANA